MINNYSKKIFNYFNVDYFVETGTFQGETLSTILNWDYEGKIDAIEIEKKYCQISTAFNLYRLLGLSDLYHSYNMELSVMAITNYVVKLQSLIYNNRERAQKIIDLANLITQEQEHWNFYSLADKGYYRYPRRRYSTPLKLHKYNIFKSDTRDFLKDCMKSSSRFCAPDNKNTFFYLDAHWDEDDYPLLEELEILTAISHLNPIIAIDDFKTPGKNYGYDTYKGRECSAAFIKDAVKGVTDTIYCCPEANFHNRGQAFVFYNRNKKDIQPLLDRYPLIEIPIK
jgi:hypothetical protein